MTVSSYRYFVEGKRVVHPSRAYDANFIGEKKTINSEFVSEAELASIFVPGLSHDDCYERYAALSFARRAAQKKKSEPPPVPVNSGNLFT